jgi:hypothetical protein
LLKIFSVTLTNLSTCKIDSDYCESSNPYSFEKNGSAHSASLFNAFYFKSVKNDRTVKSERSSRAMIFNFVKNWSFII